MKLFYYLPFALLLFGSSCSEKATVADTPKKFMLSDSMLNMIQIDTVQRCNMNSELQLSGIVSYNENNIIKIFPRAGGQLVSCTISPGDKVSAGQVLAVVHSADVAGNYADLTGSDADVAIAKKQMDNTASLYEKGIASEKEYIEAKQNYQKALAAQSKLQSQIRINGGTGAAAGGEYTLTSPINGFVVEKKVNAGNFIRQDMGDNLFTISDLKKVWITANVFEADIPKVKTGAPVVVTTLAYPDKQFKGKVDHISEMLDPAEKVMKIRIELDNSDFLLKPQMFTRVIVSNTEESAALCIPASAIIKQDGKNYIVAFNSKTDLQVIEINIIKTVGDKAFINDGLAIGQKLVTKNQLFIFNALMNEL